MAEEQRPLRKIKIKTTSPTTMPGYKNPHGQIVVCDTGFSSATFPGQRVYRLRCEHCGHTYGSNGCDIHLRRCPSHQDGARGELLREGGRGLFDQPAQ